MATKVVDLGRVVGADGAAGADGKSAYDYAVEGGYTGTEEEYKAKMANSATEQYVDEKIATVLPKSGGTMTGALYAKDDTSYTDAKVRNIKFGTDDLTAGTSSLQSGQVAMIYE